MHRSRGRSLLAVGVTLPLAVLLVISVAAIAGSASLASTATADRAGATPRQQIAALKKQVRALKAQVKDLQDNVKVLNARVTALQAEASLIPQLAEIAAATGKYRSLDGALADGYVYAGVACIPKAGVHYGRGAWPSDNELDSLRPEFLMYVPGGAGQELVAVEYAVPARFPRPTLLGQTFEMYSGGLGGEPVWYLHVWLWRLNPAGLFAPENPRVEC